MLEELKFAVVIGEASSGIEFLELIEELNPDIVLMDVKMPQMNGIEATKKALAKYPKLIIVALTMHEEDEYVKSMFDAGSRGFILKNVTKEELKNALTTLIDGKSYYYSNSLSSVIINHYLNTSNKNVEIYSDRILFKDIYISARSVEIIRLICEGNTIIEIAKILGLSKRTIQGHKYRIFKKIGVKSTSALIKYAVQHKWVKM